MLEGLVEHRLHRAERPSGATRDFGGEFSNNGVELVVRHGLVDHPPIDGFLRSQHPVREHQFTGATIADAARQKKRRTAIGGQASVGIGHDEGRRFFRDGQIGRHGQTESRTGRHPVDRRDHRCIHSRQARYARMQMAGHFLERALQAIANVFERRKIPAGTEHLAGAREHHGANVRIVVTDNGDIVEILRHLRVDGVGRIGSIQGQRRNVARDVELNGFVTHSVPLLRQQTIARLHRRSARFGALHGIVSAFHGAPGCLGEDGFHLGW